MLILTDVKERFWLSCHLARWVKDISDFWPLMFTDYSPAVRWVNDFLVYLQNKTGGILQSHYCCYLIVMLSAPVYLMADSHAHTHTQTWGTGATAVIACHLLRCVKWQTKWKSSILNEQINEWDAMRVCFLMNYWKVLLLLSRRHCIN